MGKESWRVEGAKLWRSSVAWVIGKAVVVKSKVVMVP
jgi:hypothetical protein